jgi:F-type H+-transporting ATPase subunit a
MRRALAFLTTLVLVLPSAALASTPANGEEEEKFDPSHEWLLNDWIPIHLGPLNLSINKAVAYLILGSLLTILLCWFLWRWRLKTDPDRRQTVGEWIYEIAQTQIAEQGLPTKAIGRWFPYVASLALFIWVVNMIGFIPLPLSDEKFELFGVELPTLAIYAATSTLSVTLTLALMTFIFTHVEGVRNNGFRGYFGSWMPAGMPRFTPKWAIPLTLLYLLEVLGQFMRLVSLSVRLYANMLAGHMLVLTFIGLMFVLETVYLAPFSVLFGTLFYAFEVVIVVTIQAYIFAALTAIYIGSAIEPEH